MNVVVLGGCGFVGRHFARRLLDDGHDVTIVDDMSASVLPADWMFQASYKTAFSFRINLHSVRDFVRDVPASEFDLIIHCAAVVGGRQKIEGDPLAVATDLAIDADFFNWIARTDRPQKIVYFSSSAVYPVELQQETRNCLLHESLVNFHSQKLGQPDQTYGWAKLTGEYLAMHARERYGKDVAVYRPFSGYGEDQSADYPFPSICRRVHAREQPITVWGTGTQVRDFIHIDDVVEAVLTTMRLPVADTPINLGTGIGTSMLELAALACTVAGQCATVTSILDKPTGVHTRVADVQKLRQFYTPRVSLREGIQRALDRLASTV